MVRHAASRIMSSRKTGKDESSIQENVGAQEEQQSEADFAQAFAASIELDAAKKEWSQRKGFNTGGNPDLEDAKNAGIEECEARIEAIKLTLETDHDRELKAESQDQQSVSIAAEEIDLSMIATRERLIQVFGPFTGMDMKWFRRLTDVPYLEAARRGKGQGGHGTTVEPLFCPYAVMQWLIDPKRRKGRQLSVTKGWTLLEDYFPRVYAQYSVADPRTD